jgi:hypothetical protein
VWLDLIATTHGPTLKCVGSVDREERSPSSIPPPLYALSYLTYVQTISVIPPPSRIKVVGLNLIATVTDPRLAGGCAEGCVGVVGVEGARVGMYTGAGKSDEQYIISSRKIAKKGVNRSFAESIVIPTEESSVPFPSASVKMWWMERTRGGRGKDS